MTLGYVGIVLVLGLLFVYVGIATNVIFKIFQLMNESEKRNKIHDENCMVALTDIVNTLRGKYGPEPFFIDYDKDKKEAYVGILWPVYLNKNNLDDKEIAEAKEEFRKMLDNANNTSYLSKDNFSPIRELASNLSVGEDIEIETAIIVNITSTYVCFQRISKSEKHSDYIVETMDMLRLVTNDFKEVK